MKKMVRVAALVMVLVFSLCLASSALAQSKSYKGVASTTYTIETGKKDATLKITHSTGKVTATAWKNPIKRTTKLVKNKSHYGKFEITVKCGSKQQTATVDYPFSKSASFKLAKNSKYTVQIRYLGFSSQVATYWNMQWTKSPTCKLSVGSGAKIK